MTAAWATFVCAIACVVLVLAEWRGRGRLRIASKLVASAAFLVVGAETFRAGPALAAVPFGTWMFVGLVFGAIGDACLLAHGKRAFLAGLGAFLVGHLAYVIGIAQLVPPGRWPTGAGVLAALPVVTGLGALAWLWPRLGSMRIPVIVYVGAIVAMVVAAIAAWRSEALPAPHDAWLAVGAALFFVSDLAVAKDRFVAKSFANKLWGLPAYYAGQLLIAWSIS